MSDILLTVDLDKQEYDKKINKIKKTSNIDVKANTKPATKGFSRLQGGISKVKGVAGKLGGVFKGFSPSLAGAGAALGVLAKSLYDTFTVSEEASDNLQRMKSSLDSIVRPFSNWASSIWDRFTKAGADAFRKLTIAREKAAIKAASSPEEKAYHQNRLDQILKEQKYTDQSIALRKKKRAFIVEEAKLETQIKEDLRISRDFENTTAKERSDALKRATTLTKNLGAKRVALLEEEKDLVVKINGLGANAIEDNDKVAKLSAEIIKAKGKEKDALRQLQNRKKVAYQDEIKQLKKIEDLKNKTADLKDARQHRALSEVYLTSPLYDNKGKAILKSQLDELENINKNTKALRYKRTDTVVKIKETEAQITNNEKNFSTQFAEYNVLETKLRQEIKKFSDTFGAMNPKIAGSIKNFLNNIDFSKAGFVKKIEEFLGKFNKQFPTIPKSKTEGVFLGGTLTDLLNKQLKLSKLAKFNKKLHDNLTENKRQLHLIDVELKGIEVVKNNLIKGIQHLESINPSSFYSSSGKQDPEKVKKQLKEQLEQVEKQIGVEVDLKNEADFQQSLNNLGDSIEGLGASSLQTAFSGLGSLIAGDLKEADEALQNWGGKLIESLGELLISWGAGQIALGIGKLITGDASGTKDIVGGGVAVATGLALKAGAIAANGGRSNFSQGNQIANNSSDNAQKETVLSTRVSGSDLEFVLRKNAKKSRKGN